ncbi:stage II sporulation protein D [Paenibacillus sp. JZ16]|uniref:stage II sporulation protein D n=1 Tax=Paenibacillus sp. JZ16 TaxID=1906272 RepID=UPI001F3A155F|nr:stage II sporulation protein D [Paenibacillus sp. JZ16]
MKDSKVRVNVNSAGKKRAIDSRDDLKEGNSQSYRVPSEGSAAPVLKWDFPGELEKKAGSTEAHSHDSNPDKKDIQEGPRGHRGPGRAPDAFGQSGHSTRAAHTPPPGSPAGAPAHGAAPAPGGPAAMPQGPHSAAEPQRLAPAAAGRVPRGGRTFRVRPARWGRRGFASRRPAAGRRRVRVHPAVWAVAVLLALALALPLLVVAPGNNAPEPLPPGPAPLPSAEPQAAEEPTVSVYVTKTDTVEELPLEQYLVGVLAAEMPAEFQLEALKAQAIAARTYIVQRLASGDRSGVPDGKAVVTDTVSHQAYIAQDELTKEWQRLGKEAELAKLQRAVKETAGVVMTYEGQPITASFFSTSNGYTENSEDYWKNEIPYLRSVESPWDKQISPKYKTTITMPRSEFIGKLGLADGAVPVSAGGDGGASFLKVLSYTQGHRIESVRVGGKKFTGREVREKLGLRSSQFTLHMKDGEIEITTYGNGHGVGMSQYGAEGMAREGYEAKEILAHYYTNISFDKTSNLLSLSGNSKGRIFSTEKGE